MLIYLDPNSFIDEGIKSYTKKLYIIYTYMNIYEYKKNNIRD